MKTRYWISIVVFMIVFIIIVTFLGGGKGANLGL